MRFLIAILILACGAAEASTVNVTWNFTDYSSNPQAVSRVTVTPTSKAPGVNSTNIGMPFAFDGVTGLNGSLTLSNLFTGYFYKVTLFDVNQKPVYSLTNFFPTNVSGAVNAIDYLTNFVPATFGFSALVGGTNITLTTNGGALFINSSGGSSTNAVTNVFYGTFNFAAITNVWSKALALGWTPSNAFVQLMPAMNSRLFGSAFVTNLSATNISGFLTFLPDVTNDQIQIQIK